MLETGDVGLVIKYRSRIAEFRKLPPNSRLLNQSINREELLNQFRSFSHLSVETEEQGYTVLYSPELHVDPMLFYVVLCTYRVRT